MLDHPLHPVFVHFTVALSVTSIAIYFLGILVSNTRVKEELVTSSAWLIWLSAAATVLTIITGFIQFDSVAHDAGSHLAMVNHRNWAIGTASFLLIIALWSLIRYRKNVLGGITYPLTMLGLLALIGITAYKGGDLVYSYGLGVKSTPELRELQKEASRDRHDNIFDSDDEDDGHNHEH